MNTSDITKLATERRNPRSRDIDRLTTAEMVSLINSEDKKVADAVEKVCPQIAAAIDLIYARMKRGGRLIYCGCGTSGRLGILDASECPPTYSVSPETVQAVIAGGRGAVFNAVEGAEDSAELGKEDMLKLALTENDTLVGIAASGRTPYVLGAMKAARGVGAGVIGLTCCPGSEIDRAADVGISPDTGPEVITGSTRMKCGTAQKMVLNMLSTCTMVKLGKVYGNLMVDVKPSNEKLVHRCISIVRETTGADEKTAVAALEECGYKCKTAIVMLLCSVSAGEAEARLGRSDGRVADAIR